ncbi:hypothetical protein [Mesorhizobium sp.]|uniref:hypothetical protein n=1 Tax=Mesorhizobium sp. TaxID=1871066 RepID=UPI00257BB5F6|nr:hypothetical protein [Mesorhizobium sp.]
MASGKCYQSEDVPPETFAAFSRHCECRYFKTTSAIPSDPVWLRPATVPDDIVWTKRVIQAGGDAMWW